MGICAPRVTPRCRRLPQYRGNGVGVADKSGLRGIGVYGGGGYGVRYVQARSLIRSGNLEGYPLDTQQGPGAKDSDWDDAIKPNSRT